MAPQIAWLLFQSQPKKSIGQVLPIIAYALVTAIILLVMGGINAIVKLAGDITVPFHNDYIFMAVTGGILMLIPLITLGGSAAKLSARRQDEQLSTLRLLGAAPGKVAWIVALQSAAEASVGAVFGIILYLLLTPAVGLVHLHGQMLGALLLLNPLIILAIFAGVIIISLLSALVGMMRLVISPLGVRTRQIPGKASWWRLAFVALLIIIWRVGAPKLGGLLGGSWNVLFGFAVGFVVCMMIVNIIGALLLKVVAKILLKRAKRPEQLLGIRMILESPKSSWRQVSGVALASFVAVFAGIGMSVPAASNDSASLTLSHDMQTGVIITLVGAFVVMACSIGINQAAAIMDQRELYSGLNKLGMTVATMHRARRYSILTPLAWVVASSVGLGLLAALPLLQVVAAQPKTAIEATAAALLFGVAVVLIAQGYMKQVLRSVLNQEVREL